MGIGTYVCSGLEKGGGGETTETKTNKPRCVYYDKERYGEYVYSLGK